MICHIKKKKDVNKSDQIQMGVFKHTSRNTIKLLRIQQEMHICKNTKTTLKQITIQEF